MVEICYAYFEYFIQYLENIYSDEECMDDEIKEALYEFLSQYQEHKIEVSCHDIQVDSQQVFPHRLDGHIQQISNDQEKEIDIPLVHAFYGSVIEEK